MLTNIVQNEIRTVIDTLSMVTATSVPLKINLLTNILVLLKPNPPPSMEMERASTSDIPETNRGRTSMGRESGLDMG